MSADDPTESRGEQAEQHAREIAGYLGVPDFVYHPILERKGATQREISDGMVICGDEGLIMQVKARDAPERDTHARAEQWVRKNAESARRQADGTRRRLAQSPAITFTSLRGYTRTLSSVNAWPAVVVIDHPAAPAGIELPQSTDTLWITIEDWHALHERLRSTATVIAYVQRALGSGLHPHLGDEVQRYRALAQADAAAYGGASSVPMLPMDPLGPEETVYAAVIEDLIEKVWPPGRTYSLARARRIPSHRRAAGPNPAREARRARPEDRHDARSGDQGRGPPQLPALRHLPRGADSVRLRCAERRRSRRPPHGRDHTAGECSSAAGARGRSGPQRRHVGDRDLPRGSARTAILLRVDRLAATARARRSASAG
jgi:hypothetical protein